MSLDLPTPQMLIYIIYMYVCVFIIYNKLINTRDQTLCNYFIYTETTEIIR